MNYSYSIQRLFKASSSVKMHRDLQIMHLLDEGLGFASKSFKSIHIAGSNGKGSVANKIAYALQIAGYRVGLYTSPHLFTFRERIACNSQWISEEEVASGLHEIFQLEESLGIEASFFELTTALAFTFFRQKQVDIAVIETGLGGRFDATNIINPLSTIITSISREHTHILGDELESIAMEKAGIIKENTMLILGPKARYQAISMRAKQLHAPLYLSNKISQFFDEENSAIAQLALEHLPLSISAQAIAQGISKRPACRFESVTQLQNDLIFDVAHNPDAIFHLLQALHTFFPNRQVRFVVGFSADKEYALCLQLIAHVATCIHLVQAATPRAAPLHALSAAMDAIEKAPAYELHSSVHDAVIRAQRQAAEKKELLVITGSFYIMADAKEAVGIYSPRDPCDLNEKIYADCDYTVPKK